MNDKVISSTLEYIKVLFKDNSDGHDVEHTLRVFNNAKKIASRYPESDLELIYLSSLLHDVDDHKLFNTKDNMNARFFLKNQRIKNDDIELICKIINGVSFSKNRGVQPESTEGKIVQDADRIDAIGAIGIARTFAYGGKVGRSIESSLQHFHDKLLLLKDELNTEAAKKIAESRHAYMEEFLIEIDKEEASVI